MTKIIMGDACLLNRALDSIWTCLCKLHLFSGWSETELKAFVWDSHLAYQAFMCDTAMTPLAQLAADMEAWRRLDVRVLPDEFRQRAPVQMDDGASRKRSSGLPPNPPQGGGQFRNLAADSLAVHLSSMLAVAKPKTSKILKIMVLLPTEGNIKRIIRPEFLGMCVPHGKLPVGAITSTGRAGMATHASGPSRADRRHR
jgi:hypothetical protein